MSQKHHPIQATFAELLESIQIAHSELVSQASKAVNVCLTVRNWLIGCYIVEYEMGGIDRAQYGQALIETLADGLQKSLDRCYTGRYLRLCRQFYTTYPQIRKSLISKLPALSKYQAKMSTSVTPPEMIVERLSFSHIIELIKCEDATKRQFYEIECIRGNWSVRELKR